ncbi:MAG TPA: Rieske 2Fe-2S domain-containing protein [Actinomycetota bacterium]
MAAGGIATATGLTACIDTTTDTVQVVVDLTSEGYLEAKRERIAYHFDPRKALARSFYVVPYATDAPAAKPYLDAGVAADGVMVLSDRCTHAPCRINFCASSRWFECPCHGCKYNLAGEYKLGPAPRGLDRLKFQVSGTNLIVFARTLVEGPKRGTNTTGQENEGPFCV